MRILVTRPANDAAAVTEKLERRGHRVIQAPMMAIRYADSPLSGLSGCQGLLFTSANGVRAFARLHQGRTHPVYAVGQATADTARTAGFAQVTAAGGDVHSLAALVRDRVDPQAGALFHGAGSVIAGDLADLLAPSGHRVIRQTLYHADAATIFPHEARTALETNSLDIALFYSPRTARIFMTLAEGAGILPHLHPIIAGALSKAVGTALESGPWALQSPSWQRIVIANEPTEDALFAALGLDLEGEDPS